MRIKIWIDCPVCSVKMIRKRVVMVPDLMVFNCPFCKGQFVITKKQFLKWNQQPRQV